MHIDTIKAFATLFGAVIGTAAGVIALVERIIVLRRTLQGKTRVARRRVPENVAILRPQRSGLNFLAKQEIGVILGAGILINLVLVAIGTQFTSILYLDMSGTAFAALLLGPWYGALAGLFSGIVNWYLIIAPPGHDSFPYIIVNISGGLLWGFFARSSWFARFMSASNGNLQSQITCFAVFGVLAACLMGIAGSAVELALPAPGLSTVDTTVTNSLTVLLRDMRPPLEAGFAQVLSAHAAESVAMWLLSWLKSSVLYVPDKMLSFAIAVVIIKVGFPLFERQLVHSGANGAAGKGSWMDPTILLAAIVPYSAILLLVYRNGAHRPVWIALPLLVCLGILYEYGRSRRGPSRAREKAERERIYDGAKLSIASEPATKPNANFGLACLGASLLFILVLPLLVTDFSSYFRVAFHFLCLVVGFQFLLDLYGIALSQIAATRLPNPVDSEKNIAKAV